MFDGFGFGFGCSDGPVDGDGDVDADFCDWDLDGLDDLANLIGPGDLCDFGVRRDLDFEFGGGFHGDVFVCGGDADDRIRLGGGFDDEVVLFGDDREPGSFRLVA